MDEKEMKKKNIFPDTEKSIHLFKHSPFTPMVISATDKGIVGLSFISEGDILLVDEKSGNSLSDGFIKSAISQLRAYFSGNLKTFTLPLNLSRVTEFQKTVLVETARIPYGEVRTYGKVALSIGKPGAARAVGGALARNPIALVIPCHRVVGHNGYLHGFSSPGGIPAKARLLLHEGVQIDHGKAQLNVC